MLTPHPQIAPSAGIMALPRPFTSCKQLITIAIAEFSSFVTGLSGFRDSHVKLVVSRNWFPENIFMPKLKTHKGASKRFKKTGTGKVVRQHAFARHILTSKSRKRKNKLHTSVVADDSDQAKLQRMIPY